MVAGDIELVNDPVDLEYARWLLQHYGDVSGNRLKGSTLVGNARLHRVLKTLVDVLESQDGA